MSNCDMISSYFLFHVKRSIILTLFTVKRRLSLTMPFFFPSSVQGFIIFILVVFEIIAVHWVYGINNFCRDIEFMLKRKTGWYWKFCWTLLIPILLAIIFIYSQTTAKPLKVGSYELPPGFIGMWMSATAVVGGCCGGQEEVKVTGLW